MGSDSKTRSVLLSLGSNIEPREEMLGRARVELRAELGGEVGHSSIYETEPWGFDAPCWFLNQLVEYSTELTAEDILTRCLAIEKKLGRVRTANRGTQSYASRTMDIDILLIEGESIQQPPRLVVPHPRIKERRFILIPMLEMYPEGAHPFTGETWRQLLAQCKDRGRVVLYG